MAPSDVDFAIDFAITSASDGLGLARLSRREYDFLPVKLGVRIVVWKLYVEHAVKPPVQFFETKPHPNKASALKRCLAIYRNPGWGLQVLFIQATNGERMEASEIKTWCERAAATEQ